MSCPKRMSELEPPLTTIFGILFILVSLFASCGNGLILFILWRPRKSSVTKSSKILTSLAVSDLLVGLILSPVTAWQVLNVDSLSSCNADYTRRYFTVLLVGSSVMTLGLIAYDRYILLTKLNNYNKFMTRNKIIGMLAFAWIVPALIPLFQFEVFGPHTYLSFVVLVFFLPLIIVIINYCFIVKAIREKEKVLKKYSTGTPKVSKDFFSTDSKIDVSIPSKKVKKETRKHVQLGKAVAVLICCYAICMTPINLWIPINLINVEYNFANIFVHQLFYMIAMLMSQLNSCCNPVIYFLKNPEFRKAIKRLFLRDRALSESSIDNSQVSK